MEFTIIEQSSAILRELAEIKTEQEQDENELEFAREKIISDESADGKWVEAIEKKSDRQYAPFEGEELAEKKKELCDIVIKKNKHENDKPKKRKIETYSIEIFDAIAIILTIATGIFLVATIITIAVSGFTNSIFTLFMFIAGLVGTYVYLEKSKKMSEQIAESKQIKRQNIESAEFNENEYPKLIAEYNKTAEEIAAEYDETRNKLMRIIAERIEFVKTTAEPELKQKLAEIEQKLNDERFKVAHVRECSSEQLKRMADLLDDGEADNYFEAIDLYEEEVEETRSAYVEKLQMAHERDMQARRAEREQKQAIDELSTAMQIAQLEMEVEKTEIDYRTRKIDNSERCQTIERYKNKIRDLERNVGTDDIAKQAKSQATEMQIARCKAEIEKAESDYTNHKIDNLERSQIVSKYQEKIRELERKI